MKKTIQLVVLTLILLVGEISTSIAQNASAIKRTQFCYEGDTFTVSFLGVQFDVDKIIQVRYKVSSIGGVEYVSDIGKDIGMFCYAGITMKESGTYEFGHNLKIVEIPGGNSDIKLIVNLIVLQKPDASIASRMGLSDDLNRVDHGLLFAQLVCVQEKNLVWKSNTFTLA